MPEKYCQYYLETTADLIRGLPADQIAAIAHRLWQAYLQDRQIFAFGNGGSSAAASHFIEDLCKCIDYGPDQRRYRALALTDSVSLITAWANDTDYERIFAEQLRNWVRPGDVVVAISGSGNSPNVLRGVELANEREAYTIGLCGMGGGKLSALAQAAIVVPSNNMQQIEDAHLAICHLLFCCLRDRVFSTPSA